MNTTVDTNHDHIAQNTADHNNKVAALASKVDFYFFAPKIL